MKKVFFRTFAYLIDVLLLGLILTLVVSTIPFFNDKKIKLEIDFNPYKL